MHLKTFILIPILFMSTLCLASSLREVEKEIGVEIIIDTSFQGTWESVSYEKVGDTARMNAFLDILLIEYKKYPKGYLNKAGVHKLIICDNLTIDGQKRAAIPDPYSHALYLAIDPTYAQDYLIHVMHHELHHCTEYVLFENMYYEWRKWNMRNIKKFEYGSGGVSAYEGQNTQIDYYSMYHPEKGFINLYSMLGAEEDRSEILAFMMNDLEREEFLTFVKTDKILRKKVKLIIKQINKIAETKFISWKAIKRESSQIFRISHLN